MECLCPSIVKLIWLWSFNFICINFYLTPTSQYVLSVVHEEIFKTIRVDWCSFFLGVKVRVYQENGEVFRKPPHQVLLVDKMRIKLLKGRCTKIKEEYSSAMQVGKNFFSLMCSQLHFSPSIMHYSYLLI
jgi:hypothetical protein